MEYFFTNVILPLIIGGIGAYTYPRIESYLKNRPLTVRQRKIKIIREEYERIKFLKDNPNILILESFRGLFRALIGFVVVIGWLFINSTVIFGATITRTFNAPISTLFAVSLITGGVLSIPVIFLSEWLSRLNKVLSYNRYLIDTAFKLSKLGVTAEDVLNTDDVENVARITPER